MAVDNDYADSPNNIFSDDYMSDGLFGEEDDEVGSDFHEMGVPVEDTPRASRAARGIKGLKELPRVTAQMPPKMVASGAKKCIIIHDDKVVILLP